MYQLLRTQNFGDPPKHAGSSSQAHVNTTFSVDIDDTDVDVSGPAAVTIEPLPDIAPKVQVPLRPRMGCTEKSKADASLKMISKCRFNLRDFIIHDSIGIITGLPTCSALAVNAPLFVLVTAVTAFADFAPLFENSDYKSYFQRFAMR